MPRANTTTRMIIPAIEHSPSLSTFQFVVPISPGTALIQTMSGINCPMGRGQSLGNKCWIIEIQTRSSRHSPENGASSPIACRPLQGAGTTVFPGDSKAPGLDHDVSVFVFLFVEEAKRTIFAYLLR